MSHEDVILIRNLSVKSVWCTKVKVKVNWIYIAPSHETSKARYTLATKMNSTQLTLLKVDKVDRVALAPYTLATKSNVTATILKLHEY